MTDHATPLIAFALKGLSNCWMADVGRFSHSCRIGNGAAVNTSVPHSDVYYTLNVLLGLSRIQGRYPINFDIPAILDHACRAMLNLPVPIYAYGMAMWAGAELSIPLPDATRQAIKNLLADREGWMAWRAQDLGLMISGVIAQARNDRSEWEESAHALINHLHCYYGNTETGLFYNNANSFRGRFATYATGVYLTLACFHYGEFFEDEHALKRALRGVAALGERQGPNGEWPWFYEVRTGRVVDCYPVYSVHQDGMAPAYLHLAQRHGDSSARNAIIKGFRWILGNNELGTPMIDGEHGVVHRSQRRRERFERYIRGVRGIGNWLTAADSGLIGPSKVEINRECRSYHLGWILWSFGDRSDYRELTHHSSFRC